MNSNNNNMNANNNSSSSKAAANFVNLLNGTANMNNSSCCGHATTTTNNNNINNSSMAGAPVVVGATAVAAVTAEPPPAALLPEYNIASGRYQWHLPGRQPTAELQALYQLRDVQDQIRVLANFNLVPELSFPGNILELLANLTPYPVPARLPLQLPAPLTSSTPIDYTHFYSDDVDRGVCVSTKHDRFDVVLPWHLRHFELHADWRTLPGLTQRPPLRVMQMLDQLSLASQSLTGSTSAMEDKPFPGPIDTLPLYQIQALCDHFADETVLDILRDFGIIMRSALSELPYAVLVAIQTGRRLSINRALLAELYQKATLRWLTKRYGYDRLVVVAAPAN